MQPPEKRTGFRIATSPLVIAIFGFLLYPTFFSFYSFAFISICYRLDFHLAKSEEIIRLPRISRAISGAKDVLGTAVLFDYPSFSRSSDSGVSFPKRYFRAALLGWISGYVCLATLMASRHAKCAWILSGVIAEIFFGYPLMVLFVLLLAATRGELHRVWKYSESWDLVPSSEDIEKRDYDAQASDRDDERRDDERNGREGS